ncbi:hypothetical protein BT96DRAFT_853541 [Gymnopus androsaceus JB14]|uniref:Uncharacterized protein n=1 Tax=Gymnopus androsaceus JB14 TaxID=1447944 RepID=A0A6A4I6T3_9AGAR|nr:hypothetical protein BT96DRAFT_853541 [Gymnopus androsaceus JB14]
MPHKFDNSAASQKAIKKDMQAKGLGHPAVVNDEPTAKDLYRSAPVAHDTPDGPPEPTETLKNPGSAGTDSKVGAAGATGSMEVVTDAPMRNLPPEVIDKQ